MSSDTTGLPTISHIQHTVYLSLGSNIGDRQSNLVAAIARLRHVVTIQCISSIYETEPVGYLNQGRFFNIACQGQTALTATELLAYAKETEAVLGRRAGLRNGPRPIDIDILLFDDLQIQQEQLLIPHPRMRERAFVLVPLAEIASAVVDPVSSKTIWELLQRVSQAGVYKQDLATSPW